MSQSAWTFLCFHLKCSSDNLDNLGRVIDFSVIKELLCKWLDDNWDHKMILWDQDPLFTELLKLDSSVVSIPYNPTAENLARYLVGNNWSTIICTSTYNSQRSNAGRNL